MCGFAMSSKRRITPRSSGQRKMHSLLPAWEKLPPLRRCYVRLLDPDGDVFDVWQNHLEATLGGLNDHHEVFRSQRQWEMFLDSQRKIASDWDLRNTFTEADRRLLAELKVAWEPRKSV